VNGEVCKEKRKKLWKERKKDLTRASIVRDGREPTNQMALDPSHDKFSSWIKGKELLGALHCPVLTRCNGGSG